jgi:Holliday junction resolvase RusA-like endonuclease
MSELRHFIVPGRPHPKERPRFVRGKVITPQTTLDYERDVKDAYEDAFPNAEKLEGHLTLDVFLYFNKRNHGDVDNYIKSISDALNGTSWKDDKQVKIIHAYLVVDKLEEQRAEVVIYPADQNYEEEVEKIRQSLVVKGQD